MSHENAAALEKEPVGGLLLRYSMPAIAGMVVFSLYNIVDSVFIGRWVNIIISIPVRQNICNIKTGRLQKSLADI